MNHETLTKPYIQLSQLSFKPTITMFELVELSNFNTVCATLGGFIALFGLVSYFCKERLYLSEART